MRVVCSSLPAPAENTTASWPAILAARSSTLSSITGVAPAFSLILARVRAGVRKYRTLKGAAPKPTDRTSAGGAHAKPCDPEHRGLPDPGSRQRVLWLVRKLV